MGRLSNRNARATRVRSHAKQEASSKREREPQPKIFEALSKAILAEGIGTFLLTFVAAGGEVISSVSGGEVSHASRVIAPALVVMAMIYAIGNASGAHFNPAVTFAFAVRQAFPWKWVPVYWTAQALGALTAAVVLLALFGMSKDVGATHAQHGLLTAFVMEIVLTFILVLIVLGTATRYSLIGTDAAIAVGATIACAGLFSAPISGASMNPARSFGPALVSGSISDLWIYLIGPLAGALLATAATALLHSKRHHGEIEAAQGDHLGANIG